MSINRRCHLLHIEKKTLRNVFIGVMACIILYWVLHETAQVKSFFNIIKNVLSPFVLGAALAFFFNVPMRGIEGLLKGIKQEKIRRLLAVVLTFLVVILVLTLVFLLSHCALRRVPLHSTYIYAKRVKNMLFLSDFLYFLFEI